MKYFLFTASILVFLLTACTNQTESQKLEADAFESQLENTPERYLIDVRTKEEFDAGHLERAENFDWNSPAFQEQIRKLDVSKAVFVYCLSGGRSEAAAEFLRESGFKMVYELDGGMLSWRNAGKPETTKKQIPQGLSSASFQKMVQSDKLVIVDFYAPWCAPCKQLEPILNEISKEQGKSVEVIRIDIDQNKSLTASLGITQIPFLIFYRKGKKTGTHTGLLTKDEILTKINL